MERQEEMEDQSGRALERAMVIERFQEQKEYEVNREVKSSESTDNSSVDAAFDVGAAILSGNKITKTVTDFQVEPSLDSTDVRDAMKHDEIERIRFVFADGETSKSYRWGTNDTDLVLHNIVEYYGDGEIENLLGKSVDVDSSRKNRIIVPNKSTYTKTLYYWFWRRFRSIEECSNSSSNSTRSNYKNGLSRTTVKSGAVAKAIGVVSAIFFCGILPLVVGLTSHSLLSIGTLIVGSVILIIESDAFYELGSRRLANGFQEGVIQTLMAPVNLLMNIFSRLNSRGD